MAAFDVAGPLHRCVALTLSPPRAARDGPPTTLHGFRYCVLPWLFSSSLQIRLLLIPVMMAQPLHAELESVFIPTLGHQIKIVVRSIQSDDATRIGRIGMEDVPSSILVENANSR